MKKVEKFQENYRSQQPAPYQGVCGQGKRRGDYIGGCRVGGVVGRVMVGGM